ncbi:hypothetical protein KS4_11210 [Poriferisphaera corsica]|uniref:Uncharacterized protein n=1 Tax=Poriferisphaera corsica TaxID=2528020 RepID=A0A517YS74_9BACT|nr:hypothetical protein KS4_11210 [Poriferisphaera corsica]
MRLDHCGILFEVLLENLKLVSKKHEKKSTEQIEVGLSDWAYQLSTQQI